MPAPLAGHAAGNAATAGADASTLAATIADTAANDGATPTVRRRRSPVAYGVPFDCKPGHESGAATTPVDHDQMTAIDAETAPPEESIWTREKLGGDLGGARTELAELGIALDVTVSQYYQDVVDGGVDTGGNYGGVANYVANIDGEKLGLWRGFYMNLHATTRWGRDVLSRTGVWSLPNTELLYPRPGDYGNGLDDTKLTGFYALQAFDDGAWAALAGKIHVADIFSLLMPNTLDFGQKGFININATATAHPFFRYVTFSMWGAGAWTLSKEHVPMTGLIAISSENVSTTNRSTHSSFDDGVGFLGFHRMEHTWDDKPGFITVGFGTSTERFRSLEPLEVLDAPNTAPELREHSKKKPWEVWTYLSQNLWQDSPKAERKIRLFTGASYGDDNPSFFDFNAFAALEGWGLIDGRPNDRMGISGWYSNVSSNYRRVSDQLRDPQRDVWGAELYYNYEITPWLHVTPDIQLLQGSNRGDDPALVLGVRTVLDF